MLHFGLCAEQYILLLAECTVLWWNPSVTTNRLFPFCFHSQAFSSFFMTAWKSQIHIWLPMTWYRNSILRLGSVCYQDVTKISAVLTILLHASVSTGQSRNKRHNLLTTFPSGRNHLLILWILQQHDSTNFY